MQAVAIPAVAYDALSRSFRLDDSDLNAETTAIDLGETEARVAALWGVARGVGPAQIMVLHHRNRCWVAAGQLLIEGQKGLNIGFLMPALREELAGAAPLPAATAGPRLAEADRKAIWGLAARMSRVEVERIYLLDTGEVTPIRVRRDGFALPADLAPQAVRSAIAAAAGAGRAIRYSLGTADEATWGPVHPVAALFGDTHPGKEIRLAADLWPVALPATATLEELGTAAALAGALARLEPDPECRLQLLGPGARPVAIVSKDEEFWVVQTQSLGIA